MTENRPSRPVIWEDAFAYAVYAALMVAFLGGPVLCLALGAVSGGAIATVTGRVEDMGFPMFAALWAMAIGGSGAFILGVPVSAILQKLHVSGPLSHAVAGAFCAVGLILAATSLWRFGRGDAEGVAFACYVVLHGIGYALLFGWIVRRAQQSEARREDGRRVDAAWGSA